MMLYPNICPVSLERSEKEFECSDFVKMKHFNWEQMIYFVYTENVDIFKFCL